ncbi:hypothetical protein [Paenibacillus hamazuiensis]|uniref:hypothetical protein n=1 Tax=Paenibacillus hamazuiensis TaxID=2936508 RepID=UPI00200C3BDB|nr:hypothetical protein [Paenibacillus hamazuiensis]
MEDNQVCPWCQTEIVWDPEIGPEETCPHCLNELGGYRSIKLKVKQTGEQLVFDDEDEDEELSDDDIFTYEENVQQLLDRQEETPECPSCHEFMLLAGTQKITEETFKPAPNDLLPRPLLKPPFNTKVFICPACFRMETQLGEEERTALIELLKQNIE